MKKKLGKKTVINIICVCCTLLILFFYVRTYIARSPKLAAAFLIVNFGLIIFAFLYSGSKTIYGFFRAVVSVVALVPMIPLTWINGFLMHSVENVSVLEYFLALFGALIFVVPIIIAEGCAYQKLELKLTKWDKVLIILSVVVLFGVSVVPQFVFLAEFAGIGMILIVITHMYESIRARIAAEDKAASQRVFYEIMEYITFILLFIRAIHLYYAMIIY